MGFGQSSQRRVTVAVHPRRVDISSEEFRAFGHIFGNGPIAGAVLQKAAAVKQCQRAENLGLGDARKGGQDLVQRAGSVQHGDEARDKAARAPARDKLITVATLEQQPLCAIGDHHDFRRQTRARRQAQFGIVEKAAADRVGTYAVHLVHGRIP